MIDWPIATDGEIAALNLDSARLRSWTRFLENSLQAGSAETVIEHEQLTAQFVGDLSALHRLEALAELVAERDPGSARSALIQAQIAATLHRFSDARDFLAQAEIGGATTGDLRRIRLIIDQACGLNLNTVMAERRALAAKSGQLEDLVALGALLADMKEFAEADHTYLRALREYNDVSPFALAWVCFQLGMLWGELVAEPDRAVAEQYYCQAVAYLPCYVKARVHLAEIYSGSGRIDDAVTLLLPVVSSGDPEVHWRLADALAAGNRQAEADMHLAAARSGFEILLDRHLLAFADHGAEFYADSGNNTSRALQLARINAKNRPTPRAIEQAYRIAMAADKVEAANEILAAHTLAAKASASTLALGQCRFNELRGAAAC